MTLISLDQAEKLAGVERIEERDLGNGNGGNGNGGDGSHAENGDASPDEPPPAGEPPPTVH